MANICSEHVEIVAFDENDLVSLLDEMLGNVEGFLSVDRRPFSKAAGEGGADDSDAQKARLDDALAAFFGEDACPPFGEDAGGSSNGVDAKIAELEEALAGVNPIAMFTPSPMSVAEDAVLERSRKAGFHVLVIDMDVAGGASEDAELFCKALDPSRYSYSISCFDEEAGCW